MKKKRKFLSLFLAMAMVLTFIPNVSGIAFGGTTVDTSELPFEITSDPAVVRVELEEETVTLNSMGTDSSELPIYTVYLEGEEFSEFGITFGEYDGETLKNQYVMSYNKDGNAEYNSYFCNGDDTSSIVNLKDNYGLDGFYIVGQSAEGYDASYFRFVIQFEVAQASHTHSWSKAWSSNDDYHWHECTASDCDVNQDSSKKDYGAHTWVKDENNSVAPTCSTPGTVAYKCSVCGKTKTETVDATNAHDYKYVDGVGTCTVCGHTTTCTHSEVTEVVTKPTCTEQGYTTNTCKACGEKYITDRTAVLGHNYQVTNRKDATETESGYEVYTCKNCGDSYKKTLPATGSQTRTILYYVDDKLDSQDEVSLGDTLNPNKDPGITEKNGYIASWQYNGKDITDDGLLVTQDMPDYVRLYHKYTPIDYYVRVDVGEHGIFDAENYAISEEEITAGGKTYWQGRYDIDGRSYGTDDATGEAHASKYYDNGRQSYSATLKRPVAKDGYYFTGWTITYYDNGFDQPATAANGRKTTLSSYSANTLGGSTMYGNCVISANYTDKAYVYAIPKGDEKLGDRYYLPSAWNAEKNASRLGWSIELMGGTNNLSTELTSAEEISKITGNASANYDLENYRYYVTAAGNTIQFFLQPCTGFTAEQGAVTVGDDALGLSSSTALQQIASVCNSSDKEDNIAKCDEYLKSDKASKDGVIYVNVDQNKIVKSNINVHAYAYENDNQTTSKGKYTVEFAENKGTSTYDGSTAEGKNSAKVTYQWGDTIKFKVLDKDGKDASGAIRVYYPNRVIYSNMNTYTSYSYGQKLSMMNGEYIEIYPDAEGYYSFTATPEYPEYFIENRSTMVRIVESSIDDQKEAAVKELYDLAKFNYNIAGSGSYDDLLSAYLSGFWGLSGKGNLMYSGRDTELYDGKYIIGGKEYTAAEAKAYVDAIDDSKIPAGQSKYYAGWATSAKIYAAYSIEGQLDKVGEVVEEALKALLSAETTQEIRAVVDSGSKYTKKIQALKAEGVKLYEDAWAEKLSAQLEKSYAAQLTELDYAIAGVASDDIDELVGSSEKETLVVKVAPEEDTEKISVMLKTDDFQAMADNEKSLTVQSDLGTVEFSKEAIKNVAASDRLNATNSVAASTAVYFNITATSASAMDFLTEAQKQAIGNSSVIDLSITNARGAVIDLGGAAVTVTVPYTLKAGEDADNVKVWYINNLGEAESVGGTYADGMVTFTTNHFSAYVIAKAVTKVTTVSGQTTTEVSLAKKTSLTIAEIQKNAQFEDVLKGYYAYDAISYVCAQGWMSAEDGKFMPNETLTCGEFVEILSNATGTKVKNSYKDKTVLTKSRAKTILAKVGIELDDSSRASAALTRAEVAEILYSAAE